MTDPMTPTTPEAAAAQTVDGIIELGSALIRAVYSHDGEIGLKLDALLHSYCALVALHPHLCEAAQHSLISAARAMVCAAPPGIQHPPASGRIQ